MATCQFKSWDARLAQDDNQLRATVRYRTAPLKPKSCLNGPPAMVSTLSKAHPPAQNRGKGGATANGEVAKRWATRLVPTFP